MSGICGVLMLDGTAPSQADIDPILQQLARRGPDATRSWLQGPVVLGHTLLATTPEALVETLPLTDPASGCTITADVRLDNREELLLALGLESETRVVGDGELILRAYLEWGEDCPSRLLGDFAFAIWDTRSQSLFCARDHMGMRQLIYHHDPARAFVFATEAQAVVSHPAVPWQINEGRIADFLEDMEDLSFTATFYEQVFRLPPAHHLTVTQAGAALRRYWELKPEPELILESDRAYAEAFRSRLSQAIGCRLRSTGPVGSMLSGGLDSGSVAAIAAELLRLQGGGPLKTFSAVGPPSDLCPETRCIRAAMTMPGFAPSEISHAHLEDWLEDLLRLTEESLEPFDGHMVLVRAVCLLAHQQGVRVLLDGVGADVVMSSDSLLASLLKKGRFIQALREARGEARFWGDSWPARKALARAMAYAGLPRRLRDLRHRLSWSFRNRRMNRQSLIHPDFAARVGLRAKRARYRRQLGSDLLAQEWRSDAITRVVSARERYDRVASALAIELRDPFMDVRLIRFCLSLPFEQLQHDGWPKIVMRRAMAAYLPEEIRWRRGKEHLGLSFIQALQVFARGRARCAPDKETISPYVDLERARAAKASPRDSRRFAAWSETVYLRNWLESGRAEIEDE